MIPNIDEKTGIRYGVISKNSVDQEFLWEILTEGIDTHYEAGLEEKVNDLKNQIENYLDDAPEEIRDYLHDNIDYDQLDDLAQEQMENWEADGSGIHYKKDGYHIITTELELMVLKSPVIVTARLCSPCFPNAGDLDSLDETGIETYGLKPEDLYKKEG